MSKKTRTSGEANPEARSPLSVERPKSKLPISSSRGDNGGGMFGI